MEKGRRFQKKHRILYLTIVSAICLKKNNSSRSPFKHLSLLNIIDSTTWYYSLAIASRFYSIRRVVRSVHAFSINRAKDVQTFLLNVTTVASLQTT